MIKDPFARKMWKAGLGFAGGMLILFLALTAIYFHLRPRCPDKPLSETVSPDKRWIASVLQRRCGEEAPFVTTISIRSGASPLELGFFSGQLQQSPVFTIEQDALGAGITLQWTGPDQLIINCRNCAPRYIRRQDARSGAVTIDYQLSAR
ncbi:MAG TPA: hypothetical protein VE783_03265 [Candidatus Limnocylindrales bacterium]|nr:hypothetical protein [Candidatus Limnocylindrales bacterium]